MFIECHPGKGHNVAFARENLMHYFVIGYQKAKWRTLSWKFITVEALFLVVVKFSVLKIFYNYWGLVCEKMGGSFIRCCQSSVFFIWLFSSALEKIENYLEKVKIIFSSLFVYFGENLIFPDQSFVFFALNWAQRQQSWALIWVNKDSWNKIQ